MAQDIKYDILNYIRTGKDDRVLSYLYQTTLSKVRKYILKNGGSKDDANDVFQDSVIIFFNQVRQNKFNEKYDIDGFIYSVARNLWIDKVRRDKRMVRYDTTEEFEATADTHDSLQDLISKEKTQAMRMVFEQLDEKCRNILHYVLHEKLSMKEVSVKMGYSSEDVAKTNHYRCKQYLTKLVKNNPTLVNLLRH